MKNAFCLRLFNQIQLHLFRSKWERLNNVASSTRLPIVADSIIFPRIPLSVVKANRHGSSPNSFPSLRWAFLCQDCVTLNQIFIVSERPGTFISPDIRFSLPHVKHVLLYDLFLHRGVTINLRFVLKEHVNFFLDNVAFLAGKRSKGTKRQTKMHALAWMEHAVTLCRLLSPSAVIHRPALADKDTPQLPCKSFKRPRRDCGWRGETGILRRSGIRKWGLNSTKETRRLVKRNIELV